MQSFLAESRKRAKIYIDRLKTNKGQYKGALYSKYAVTSINLGSDFV